MILVAGVIEERRGRSRVKEILALGFVTLALATSVMLYQEVSAAPGQILVFAIGGERPWLAATFEIDLLSVYMVYSIVTLGFLVVIYSYHYMEHDTRLGEYYALLLLLMAGMVGVALAGDFFTLFIFWELMCISSYVLVAFRRDRWGPIEAGFKYFVMSSLGSVLILISMSLLYGMSGNVNFAYMSIAIDWRNAGTWAYLAFILAFLGFGIKAAIVPMHTWLPDAHPEAPTPISAMLSGMLIETGLYGLIRVFFIVFVPNLALLTGGATMFKYIFAAFAFLTMTLGNILALLQKDIKRLLACSSIAQMGYMLVGIASGTIYGLFGTFLHILNHSFMKGLAFLASGALAEKADTRDIDEMKGVGRYMPITTIALTISFLGLCGVPTTSGFISKFVIFGSALQPGVDLWWLAIAGVLNSALSVAYYLRTIQRLVTKPEKDYSSLGEAPASMLIPVVAMAILIVVFGIYPQPLLQLADGAARALIDGVYNYILRILI